MTTNLREIITNLIDSNIVQLAYYDHSDMPYHSNFRIKTAHDMPHYDGNDEFHEDYEPCLLFAGSGDYAGSTIDMANRRYIEEDYPELIENDHIIYDSQGFGFTQLVIFFLRLPVARSGLFDDMEGLADYPLLNDELESTIQDELLEKAWNNWVSYEFESEIEKRTGYEFIETNWQSDLFWDILRHGGGGEYFPEGTDIWVDMDEVFNDKEMLIETIQKHADDLDTGEYKISGEYRPTGYELIFDWSYKGKTPHEDRQTVLDLHKSQKVDTVPDSILKEFGLKWWQVMELFWEVKPINALLKNMLKSGIIDIRPQTIFRPKHYDPCGNCHGRSVMFVFYGDNRMMQICDNCYNKLMEYWPKCEHCGNKNVNASLQLALLPELEDSSNLTHCTDCKNSLLDV